MYSSAGFLDRIKGRRDNKHCGEAETSEFSENKLQIAPPPHAYVTTSLQAETKRDNWIGMEAFGSPMRLRPWHSWTYTMS